MQDKKNQQTSHKKAHKTIPTTTNQQTGSVPSRPSGPHRFVAYTNRAPRAARKIVHRLVQEGGFPSSTDPSTDDKMGERLLCFFPFFFRFPTAGRSKHIPKPSGVGEDGEAICFPNLLATKKRVMAGVGV